MIGSIFFALLGGTLGSAVKNAVDMAERTVTQGEAPEGPVTISASLVGSAVAALLGTVFLGPRRAFWLSALFAAAGADRLDRAVLRTAGIDVDALVAKAQEAAKAAAARRGGGEEAAEAAEAAGDA
jgi:hypothetical protein